MEKCGMHYERTTEHYGMEVVYYAITRDEFFKPKTGDISIRLM